MPIYTYHCENCQHEFDKYQGFSEEPLRKCPNCGKLKLNKVYKPAMIVFKGKGFYATDHRSASGNGRGSGAADPVSESTEKKSEGGEKKSESKAEKPKASEKASSTK